MGLHGALRHRASDFSTLLEALEYAALGDEGVNFYDGKGELTRGLSYRALQDEARGCAHALLASGLKPGSRVAIMAETDPVFPIAFFACQYAGLIPVALPASVQVGAREHYIEHLTTLLETCDASLAIAPESHMSFLEEAAAPLGIAVSGLPACDDTTALPTAGASYLQYTSGSTRAPRGVEVTQAAVMANLKEMTCHGLKVTNADRFVSWLPLYHDMGLVGLFLLPMVNQCSADLMSPRTFAMRPRLWLKIISQNAGTITSSPPFGYALCTKRLRQSDLEKYDLSSLRAACVGAERIQAQGLDAFAQALKPCGFDPAAFVPCYGMAETALAVSFVPLNEGFSVEVVDRQRMENDLVACPAAREEEGKTLTFVDCGKVLPSYEMKVLNARGEELGERQCGTIWLKGPCVMQRYFKDPEATAKIIDDDGWLNTGDIGYVCGERLFLTARSKEVIILNGRNIWPQDLEHLAEEVEGVRGASAFGCTDRKGAEQAVVLVECRGQPERLATVKQHIAKRVQNLFGISAKVELVSPGELPRTSSGKLSRARARLNFIGRTSVLATNGQANGSHSH